MDEGEGAQGLLAALPALGLPDAIDDAIRSRTLALDSTQYEYLPALMSAAPRTQPTPGIAAPATAGSHSANGLQDGMHKQAGRPKEGTIKELIAAVRDVLPDYGPGFVEACLQVCPSFARL